MADATQKLQIKLTGDSAGARAEIGATERDLKRLPDAAAAVNKESRAAAGGLRELAGSVAALVGGGLAVEQFVAANREASRLRASLNVLTGDAQTTAAVWRTLQAEFGASIGVEAAAAAFQKLKALGLSAGTETIRSYSNTAAAMGKSTQDFVEAVADAVTGEFERLKEFGIKSAAAGNQVKFTFQGVTTAVANNAAAIEQYLVGIGNHQFGGALAEQAKTLDGAFGRVESSARQLWQALGDTGAAAALASGLNAGATALDALRQQIGDGSLFAGLAESAEQSGAVAAQSIESLGVSLEGVQYAATETGRVIAEAIPDGVRFAAEAIAELPLNLRVAVGIMAGELDKFGADAVAVWEGIKLGASIAWSATTNVVIESTDRMRRALSGVAESAARALAGALGVEGASFGFEGGVGDRTTDRTQEFEQRRAQIAAERKSRQDAADAAVAGFLRERDAARTAAGEQAALAEGDRRRIRALRDVSDHERFHAAAVAATGAAAGAAGKQAGDAAKKAAAEQKKFADELARTVAAVDPVAGAVARYSEQVGTLDAALAKGLITQQRHDALVRDAALDYRDRVDVVGAYIRKLEQENQLLGLNGTERDQARAVLEAETAARRAGLEVTDAQRAAIRGLVAEQEQLRAQAEPLAKLYEHAAEEIYSGWSKMWEDLFSGGIKSFKDFGKSLSDYLRRLLGQLAAQALARPVLVPVITALGGTLGMSQSAIGGTLQQLGLGGGATTTGAGGGLGAGNLSSISNLFGGSGISGAFVGAGNWLANTTGLGAASSAGVSPASLGVMGVPGGVGTATTNGGIFAGAAGLPNWAFGAAGLGGGLIGGWLGGSSPYGSAAGSLGGIAGMVGASSLASGTALGATLGSAVPVIGTLIGGALGGVIARAFGDSQPDNAWFRVTSGARSGRDAQRAPLAEAQTAFGSVAVSGWEDLPGQMQAEFSKGIVDAFAQSDAALAQQLGAQYVEIARKAVDGQAVRSTAWVAASDPAGQVAAVFKDRYLAIFGALDGALAAALSRQTVTADSIGQVVAELGELFAVTHRTAAESLGPYATQLKALDAEFGRLAANAQKYGYMVAEVAAQQAQATAALTAAFNADVAGQIKQLTDPTGYALDQLDAAFATVRADAAAVGGDLAAVEQLYGLKRTEILKDQLAEQQRIAEEAAAKRQEVIDAARKNYVDALQRESDTLAQTRDRFRAFAADLARFRDSLSLQYGQLSPEARLAETQRQFQQTSALARLGNEDALGNLTSVSQQYLDAAKDYYASSEGYFDALDAVQAATEAAQGTATRQADIAAQQYDVMQAQLRALGEIRDALTVKQAAEALAKAQGGGGLEALALDPNVAALQRSADAAYLAANPDVAQAVARGEFASARDHWLKYGMAEGRSYAAQNSSYDVAQAALDWQAYALASRAVAIPDAVSNDWSAAGRAQYDALTAERSRQVDYLLANPDVARAIADGSFTGTAEDHYRLYGMAEGRKFADGGYAAPGWALVGERGPELVNFGDPARVYTADQTRAALDTGRGERQHAETVEELRALVRVQAEAAQRLLAALGETNERLARIERQQRLGNAA